MEWKLLRQILMMAKYAVVGIFLQALLGGLLLAREGNAQRKSMEEIYVNIKAHNRHLKQVLDEIELKTGLNFTYESSLVEDAIFVNASADNETLANLLRDISKETGLGFKRVNENVHVVRKSHFSPPVVEVVVPQEVLQVRISGKVTSADDGQPLPGVSIVVKGTTTGTTTDMNGAFALSAPEGAVLQFSYIGFVAQEITLSTQTELSVVMQPDMEQLQEVVVVGYGTQSKRNLTASVSSVKSEDIRQVPIMSPEQALQGRAAGVQVMQSNGAPGGVAQVQIRGVNSTSASGNNPLYVIDGVPLFDPPGDFVPNAGGAGTPQNNTTSPIATLNPADIESIEVLKDASATAIYGARAANGVVVITTKSGKAGKTSYQLDYYYGVQQMQNKWELVNGIEGMILRKEALLNTRSDFTRNIPAEMFNPFALASSPTYRNVSWQDELFRTAPIQDFNLSATGGNDKLRYMVSGNYFNQDGIFRNTYMERYSTRVNLDVQASERLSFGVRTTVAFQKGNNVTDGNPFQGNVIGALFQPGFQQVFNPDGSYWAPPHTVGTGTFDTRNPIFEADKFVRPLSRFRFNGNLSAEYQIVKGLSFKSTFGVDVLNSDQDVINPAIPRGPAFIVAGPDLGPGNPPVSRAYAYNTQMLNWVADQLLNYQADFGDDHSISALLGFSAQKVNTSSYIIGGQGSINPVLQLVGSNNNQIITASEGFGESGLVSQFARLNYAFKGKYLFTGTVRRDGSSNFGAANRYGIFPSASLGWRVSDEAFFQNIGFISDLKIRASYGLTGNQNIGAFGFISRMGGSNAAFGSVVANGFAPNNLANEGLQWESNEQTDIGIDVAFLKGRIQLTADYFIKNANDLLVGIPIPAFSGFQSQTVNLGKIQNKGFEMMLNAQIIDKAFKWSASFNVSAIKNEVLDLGTNAAGGVNEFFGYAPFTTNGPMNITRAGLPIGSFYGLRTNGIFRSIEETNGYSVQPGIVPLPGDYKYVDQNNDGVINNDDRVVLGSPFPDFFGGLTNDFSYKNFTLSVFANFVQGMQVFNHTRLMLEDFGDASGSVNQLDRYSASNPNTSQPRMTLGNIAGYNRLNSDRWIDDASFLRIRNITLAYQIPSGLVEKAHLQSARVYVNVNNAFTFTKYQGWDPEVNSSGSNVLSGGIDQGGYPVARSFVFGFNLKF